MDRFLSSFSFRRSQRSIADSSSFSGERTSSQHGGAAASLPQLLHLETLISTNLLHLCSSSSSSASSPLHYHSDNNMNLIDMSWISDAIAVLLSAHSSAAASLPPSLVSAAMDDRKKVQEYMDSTVGLLDVCNSLREASYGLDQHLSSVVGAAEAFLCSSGNSSTTPSSNSPASSPSMKAAGRRLYACLAGFGMMEKKSESIKSGCSSKVSIMMDSKKKEERISSDAATRNRAMVSISAAKKWQKKLQEAEATLEGVQKKMRSKALRVGGRRQQQMGGDEFERWMEVQAMARILSGINEATLMVVGAAIGKLKMAMMASNSKKGSSWAWAGRGTSSSRSVVSEAAAMGGAGGGVLSSKNASTNSSFSPLAEPLRQLRRTCASSSSYYPLFRPQIPNLAADPSDSAVFISHVTHLLLAAQALRPSIASFHTLMAGLCDELTRLRIALLDATSSSTILYYYYY